MLLPSALSCDVRRPSRFAAASRLLSTPPPSDDEVPVPSGNGLMGTCRALQSLLNGSSPAPSPRRSKPARLQSPLHITRSTPSSSSSAAARSRNLATPASPKQTTPAPPAQSRRQRKQSPRTRGVNKRRRNSFESDFDYYSYDRNVRDREENDDDRSTTTSISDRVASRGSRFSTPKRRRHVPYDLPLGLSQSDFYSLHSPPVTASPSSSPRLLRQPASQQAQPEPQQPETEPETRSYNPDAALPSIEEEAPASAPTATDSNPTPWSEQDDQCLVEAVLEKFQLSQEDWDECAQRVGRDQASAGRRWQALVGKGNVGLLRPRTDKTEKSS